MSAQHLSPDQLAHFAANGYILIPELIPLALVDPAADGLWKAMDLSADHPAAWPGTITSHTADDPALLACYTEKLRAIVAQLTGAPPTQLEAPDRAFAINSFPLKIKGRWKWPKPHIDNGSKAWGRKITPPPHRLVTLIYLSDVGHHGGGTVVWPGSHRLLSGLAKEYTFVWQLNEQLGQLDLGDPVEMTPRRGDVLFYHRLLVHAGSANTTPLPRLALHKKWCEIAA